MSRGMVAHDVPAARGINRRRGLRSGCGLTFDDLANVDDQPANRSPHIFYVDGPAIATNYTCIADLAARLDVERRAVQHDLHAISDVGRVYRLPIAQDCQDMRLTLHPGIRIV